MTTDPSEMGKKGGKARAEKLSKEEKSRIASVAARARWGKDAPSGAEDDVPEVLCGSPDRPMRLGEVEVACYVLDDERRVIIQRGMMTALDMAQGTAGRGDGDRLSRFLATKALNSLVSKELRDVITSPIRFKTGSSLAYGYEATVLADICDVVLQARKDGTLHYQQEHIADQCEMLLRAFAKVGIVALVDEATGYQYVRQRDALERLLEEFLSEELRRWVKTFPGAYFRELCRLRGVPFRPDMRLPQYFGHLTNDIVYKRLAPGVLQALQERSPKNDQGNRPNKLHQWLSENMGHPKLIQHLGAVIALMRVSEDWASFKKLLDQAAAIPDAHQGGLFNQDDD
ncbi:MAG: P63C domain-containing protein [Phycisphaeraceae bacterium]|nr:P63C domain-containing protein [Phycisphaeraceae bacterium]MCW5761610.1 P63C domain-containing protein [Phycisphaeraceae bacterium]